MAQRYGRNRKRAHLARIAELEAAYQRECALLRDKSRRLSDLESEVEQWDDEIRRQFGEYSAIRRHTPKVTSRYPMRELPVYEPVSPRYSDHDITAMSMTMSKERMRRFVLRRHDDLHQMRRHMRLIEVDGHGEVVYSISDPALMRGFGPRDEEYLARTIARSMVNHWNGAKKP